MTSVNDSMVTDAVLTLLRAEIGVPVGDGTAPSAEDGADRLSPTDGWLIVHAIPIGDRSFGDGYVGQSASGQTIRYQLTAGGVQRNQADRIANAAAAALADRESGDWVNPIPVGGHQVMDRRRVGRIPDDAMGTFQAGQQVDLMVTVI